MQIATAGAAFVAKAFFRSGATLASVSPDWKRDTRPIVPESRTTGTTGAVYKLVAVPSQFLNISTRARVGTGDNALIGGFILRGTAQKKVLVRALGPSLTQFGLTDVLADPTVELRGPNGAFIASNDNWKSSQQTEIEMTGLQPTDDAESALIADLPATDHTAIVRGTDSNTGIGVVEVYDLDCSAMRGCATFITRGQFSPSLVRRCVGFIRGRHREP